MYADPFCLEQIHLRRMVFCGYILVTIIPVKGNSWIQDEI